MTTIICDYQHQNLYLNLCFFSKTYVDNKNKHININSFALCNRKTIVYKCGENCGSIADGTKRKWNFLANSAKSRPPAKYIPLLTRNACLSIVVSPKILYHGQSCDGVYFGSVASWMEKLNVENNNKIMFLNIFIIIIIIINGSWHVKKSITTQFHILQKIMRFFLSFSFHFTKLSCDPIF